jgi:hypothetical protein
MRPNLRSPLAPISASGGRRGALGIFIVFAALGLIVAPIARAQVLDLADAAFLVALPYLNLKAAGLLDASQPTTIR